MQMKGPKWFDLNHDGEISRMERIFGEGMDDIEKYQTLEDTGLDPSDFDL